MFRNNLAFIFPADVPLRPAGARLCPPLCVVCTACCAVVAYLELSSLPPSFAPGRVGGRRGQSD